MKSTNEIDNESVNLNKDICGECQPADNTPPHVPLWRIWALRVFFAGMVFVLGKIQLQYILEGPSEWSNWRGLGHSMLFALALFAIGGLFRPLAFLPIMIFEVVWKAVWLLVVALPLFLAGEEIPGIVDMGSRIGIWLIVLVIPWNYVWWRYFKQPIEPWRRNKNAQTEK